MIDVFKQPHLSAEIAYATCMAWGAMTPKNSRMAWPHAQRLFPLIDKLRAGEFDRITAYQAFQETPVPHVGIAYFTKLIFFGLEAGGVRPAGYIMDQWTARSINLLFGAPIVHVQINKKNNRGYVTDRNGVEVYKRFCAAVDYLGEQLGAQLTPSDIEERIFSRGKPKMGQWREYVLANG